jgi:hypothetical protein
MLVTGDCASILVVVSPAYLKSEWCERERSVFLSFRERRQSGHPGAIFMVSIEPADQGKLPVSLGVDQPTCVSHVHACKISHTSTATTTIPATTAVTL